MEFAAPPYPWAVFSGVLVGVSVLNYMIASLSSPRATCIAFWAWIIRVYVYFKDLIRRKWLELRTP
jgi:hypothetical protein